MKTDWVIIALFWGLSLFLINPIGNFPLNDDWSFGLAVKHFLEHGDFRPTDWVSMPLISNVLWGAIFCLPDGFSFTALRVSTLVLSLAGIFGSYVLIRDMHQPRWLALLAALLLAFNPLYYALSNTFMTDVAYTALAIFAAIFLARNLRTGRVSDLIFGTALVLAATLSRQLAIAIPLAFAVCFMARHGLRAKNVLLALLPLALAVITLLLFEKWLKLTGRTPELYSAKTEEMMGLLADPKKLVFTLVKNVYVGLSYLGLFLLPILAVQIKEMLAANKKRLLSVSVFSFVAITAVVSGLLLSGRAIIMPTSGNVIVKSGVGPVTLPDVFVLDFEHIPALPGASWVAVTAMSMVGAFLLLSTLLFHALNLFAKLRTRSTLQANEIVGVFLLLSTAIYLAPLFIANFFDRYLIAVIPFCVAGLVGVSGKYPLRWAGNTKAAQFVAIACLCLFSFFAIFSTRDYLTWNRVRWLALNDLLEKKQVSPQEIDGGFEFNGFYLYQLRSAAKKRLWVHEDTYQITFGVIPGYSIFQEYNYANWLPPRQGKVLVLQKNPPDHSQ